MLCEKCKQKPAVVKIHQIDIFNGTKTEVSLCQECHMHLHMEAPSMEAMFSELLGSLLSATTEKQPVPKRQYRPCPVCGMTYEDFKKGGSKLGCEACYRVFARELTAILKNVQNGLRHEGKFPRHFGQQLFQKREVARLRSLMQKAIAEEDFEEAARLRDEVRSLETALMEEL